MGILWTHIMHFRMHWPVCYLRMYYIVLNSQLYLLFCNVNPTL